MLMRKAGEVRRNFSRHIIVLPCYQGFRAALLHDRPEHADQGLGYSQLLANLYLPDFPAVQFDDLVGELDKFWSGVGHYLAPQKWIVGILPRLLMRPKGF